MSIIKEMLRIQFLRNIHQPSAFITPLSYPQVYKPHNNNPTIWYKWRGDLIAAAGHLRYSFIIHLWPRSF